MNRLDKEYFIIARMVQEEMRAQKSIFHKFVRAGTEGNKSTRSNTLMAIELSVLEFFYGQGFDFSLFIIFD